MPADLDFLQMNQSGEKINLMLLSCIQTTSTQALEGEIKERMKEGRNQSIFKVGIYNSVEKNSNSYQLIIT